LAQTSLIGDPGRGANGDVSSRSIGRPGRWIDLAACADLRHSPRRHRNRLPAQLIQGSSLPIERAAHDPIEIVKLWNPSKLRSRETGVCQYCGRISGSSVRKSDVKFPPIDALNCLQDLKDRLSLAVAAIRRDALSTCSEAAKCKFVRNSQILDVDVVSNARSVRRGIVGAEDFHEVAYTQRSFACHLYQMRSAPSRLPSAPPRVCARDTIPPM
jgi:hypothetical protein